MSSVATCESVSLILAQLVVEHPRRWKGLASLADDGLGISTLHWFTSRNLHLRQAPSADLWEVDGSMMPCSRRGFQPMAY